jgi:hypothetical protein
MTTHLTPEEIVDAAEGRLSVTRQAHVSSCRACAGDVAAHAALLQELDAVRDVPEPSPLFWDHFSARTRAAIAAAPQRSTWSHWLRPLVALAAAAAVLLVVWLRPGRGDDADMLSGSRATGPAPLVLPAVEDGPWDLVLDLASGLPFEDVQQAAAPRRGTADALIDELTPAEREAFVKLLRSEIGELE